MIKHKNLLPILIFSILFCCIFYNNYYLFDNKILLESEPASWITSQSDSDIQYFRKDFYIPEKVNNAWLIISASDRYKVYVNGKFLGKEIKDGWYPSKNYDITKWLKVGKNVISIKTTKRKFSGEPKIMAEIGYVTISNNKEFIYTDENWKAGDYKNITTPTTMNWFGSEFDDSDWAHAIFVAGPNKISLEDDPEIFRTPVDTKQWFWLSGKDQIRCSSKVELPGYPKIAWIRVSSWGDLKVGVNGDIVDSTNENFKPFDDKEFPAERNKGIYVYDIRKDMSSGNNTINISSFASNEGKGLYIDGLIAGNNWKKALNSKDFNCFDSEDHGYLEKIYLSTGLGNFEKKILLNVNDSFSLNVYLILELLIFSIILSALLILLSSIISKRLKIRSRALSITYLLPTLYLLCLVLFSFDVRYGSDFIHSPSLAIFSLLLLFIQWPIFLMSKRINIKRIDVRAIYLVFFVIILVGFFLRLQNINIEGFHWDEAQMSEKVEGVLKHGYPSLEFSDTTPRYISTSELLVYIQALSVSLLSHELFSLRFPSVLFGIFTIIFLFFFGKLIGGYRVGLLSSTAYAILPPSIGMSVFARYPSQLAFFSLLSVYLFIKYLNSRDLRFWILSLISMTFSYFSWQASIFLVIPLLIWRVVVGGKEKLFRDSAYLLLILAVPVSIHVIIKKLSRSLIEDYSLFGPSLALSSFKLNFLSTMYEPFFYIKNYLFVEGFHFLTLLFIFGIPILFIEIKKRRELILLYFIIIFVPFIMTSLLANNTYRYAFYMTPFLILISSFVFIYFLDSLYNSDEFKVFKILNFVFALIFFVFFASGSANFQNFPYFREGLKTNLNLRNFPDIKKASVFLNQNVKEHDVVISMTPHLHNYYFDKIDYFFESKLQIAVFKNYKNTDLSVHHKVLPIPAILSLGELKNVINSARGNVWLVASPEKYKFFDKDTINFLEGNRKLVFESYDTNIYNMR